MLRIKLLLVTFLLISMPGVAQKVTVSLKNAEIKIVEFIGMNEEILYLEIDGNLLKIPLSEISEIKDLETDELIEFMPQEIVKESPPPKPREPLDIMNNFSSQPLVWLGGVVILELEIRTTDSTSLAIRGVKTGPPLSGFGNYPINGYGLGLRYRFYLDNIFGVRGFYIGPTSEYAKGGEVEYYWNTGLEFGYQFIWGKNHTWISKLSIDMTYQSAKIDGSLSTMLRFGPNLSLGMGF